MVLDVYVSGNLETIHMRDLEEKLSRLKRFEGAYPGEFVFFLLFYKLSVCNDGADS